MYREISDAAAFIANKFYQWGIDTIQLLPNLIVALLLLLLFVLFARLVRRGVARLLTRFMHNEAVVRLIAKLAYIFVIAIGILISLEVLHLERTVTSLLAGIGVIGLGLGIAFQDLAANFISGVSMAMKNQVKIGDLIKTGDYYGTVTYVGLRETIIRTITGQDVIIPNKEIYQNPMIHYTAHKKRRIDLAIGVSYGEDLAHVEKVTLEAIRGLNCLLKGQDVELYFNEFASSSINLEVQYWISFRTHAEYVYAVSEGIKAVKAAYNANGITIPFPIRTLDFGIKGGTPLAELLSDSPKTGK